MGRPGGQAIMSKAVTPQTSSATRAGHGTRPMQRAVAAPSVRPAIGTSPAWGYQIGRLSIQAPVASQPLPQPLRGQMERSFDADFSTVRVAQGPEAARMGTLAFTQGESIHFAPGQLDPHSTSGRRLFAHELAHVLQQRAGLAKTAQGKGAPLHHDADLEAEADRASQQVEAGQPAQVAGVTSSQRHTAPGTTQPPVAQGKVLGGRLDGLLGTLRKWLRAPVTLARKGWDWAHGTESGADNEAANVGPAAPQAAVPKEVIEDGPQAGQSVTAAAPAEQHESKVTAFIRAVGGLVVGAAGFVVGLVGTAASTAVVVTGAGLAIAGLGLVLTEHALLGVISGAAATIGAGLAVGGAVAAKLWAVMRSMGRFSLSTLYAVLKGAHYLLSALSIVKGAINEKFDQLWDYLAEETGGQRAADPLASPAPSDRRSRWWSGVGRAVLGYVKLLLAGPFLALAGLLAAASFFGNFARRLHYFVSGLADQPLSDRSSSAPANSDAAQSRFARWGWNALHLLGLPLVLPIAALARMGRFVSTLWWMRTGEDLVEESDRSGVAIAKLIGYGVLSLPALLLHGILEAKDIVNRWRKDTFGKEAIKYGGAVAGIAGAGLGSYYAELGKPSSGSTADGTGAASGSSDYQASSAGGYAAMGLGSVLNFGEAVTKFWNARKRVKKGEAERDAAARRIGKRDMRNAGFSMATATGSMVTSAMTMAAYFTGGREATMGMQQFQQYASGSAVSFAGNVFTSVGAGASMVGGAINLATGVHGFWSTRKHTKKLEEVHLTSDAAKNKWLPHIQSQLGWRKRLLSLKSIGGAVGIAAGALLIASNPVGWALGAAAAAVGTGFVIAKIVKKLADNYKLRKAQAAAPAQANLSADQLKQHSDSLTRSISKNAEIAGEMIDAIRSVRRHGTSQLQLQLATDAIKILEALGIHEHEALSPSGQELIQLRLGRMHGV